MISLAAGDVSFSAEMISIGAVSLAVSAGKIRASIMVSFDAMLTGSLVVSFTEAFNVVLFNNVVLFIVSLLKAVVSS
jgi:hypothetical protein